MKSIGIVRPNGGGGLLWEVIEDDVRGAFPSPAAAKGPGPMGIGEPFNRLPAEVQPIRDWLDMRLGNALDDRQIVVRTELSDSESILFTVSDGGPGIAAEDLKQVFEPFFTSKSFGLGLGLSVCRSIISTHGGKPGAVNDPECGVTFHFTLHLNNGS